MATMSAEAWAATEELARRDGLDDAAMFGLAVGCPRHGNASMDWDNDGVFCHVCVNGASTAEVVSLEMAAAEAAGRAWGAR